MKDRIKLEFHQIMLLKYFVIEIKAKLKISCYVIKPLKFASFCKKYKQT